DQRFECAAIPMMTELYLKHVVGNRLREVCGCVRKDEFGASIDKLMDKPGRTYAINFWSWAGDPCFASIILYLKPRSHFGPLYRGFQRFCFLKEPLQIFATRALEIVDLADFLKAPAQFVQLAAKGLGGSFASFLIPNQASEGFSNLIVVACTRVVEKRNNGGVRHALDVFDPDQSGFTPAIDDFFFQPLKHFVLDALRGTNV